MPGCNDQPDQNSLEKLKSIEKDVGVNFVDKVCVCVCVRITSGGETSYEKLDSHHDPLG